MARKHQSRDQRAGTVINLNSKKQEGRVRRSPGNCGSFFFRVEPWSVDDVPERSVHYYFAKYGKEPFALAARPGGPHN